MEYQDFNDFKFEIHSSLKRSTASKNKIIEDLAFHGHIENLIHKFVFLFLFCFSFFVFVEINNKFDLISLSNSSYHYLIFSFIFIAFVISIKIIVSFILLSFKIRNLTSSIIYNYRFDDKKSLFWFLYDYLFNNSFEPIYSNINEKKNELTSEQYKTLHDMIQSEKQIMFDQYKLVYCSIPNIFMHQNRKKYINKFKNVIFER